MGLGSNPTPCNRFFYPDLWFLLFHTPKNIKINWNKMGTYWNTFSSTSLYFFLQCFSWFLLIWPEFGCSATAGRAGHGRPEYLCPPLAGRRRPAFCGLFLPLYSKIFRLAQCRCQRVNSITQKANSITYDGYRYFLDPSYCKYKRL